MHRVFLIEEILHQIVEGLVNTRHAGAPDLVSFALTSKVILELALDSIWYTLPNISPVVRCFPRESELQGIKDTSGNRVSTVVCSPSNHCIQAGS